MSFRQVAVTFWMVMNVRPMFVSLNSGLLRVVHQMAAPDGNRSGSGTDKKRPR
jgi:hypothetical protein